ncbi:hypothetical protein GCM10023184_46040 [Flaviaesturariibacter amylovorans]|uniref:ASCH domain-containing protein n=2 Tax=Flaviaesturariibacter amylovorans TaxID=1084520 RepID=A0ABP8HUA9_9BACT
MSAAGQRPDSCSRHDLKPINYPIYLKGLPFRDSATMDAAYLRKGIELGSPGKAKVIGFTVMKDCDGCDIVDVTVCGPKADPMKYPAFFNRIGDWGWLMFYNINIEVDGRRYQAPEFKVVLRRAAAKPE